MRGFGRVGDRRLGISSRMRTHYQNYRTVLGACQRVAKLGRDCNQPFPRYPPVITIVPRMLRLYIEIGAAMILW